MKEKRGRGRPRTKPIFAGPGTVRALHPFERLEEGALSKENIAQIIKMIRTRGEARWPLNVPFTRRPEMRPDGMPVLAPPSDELRKWLGAAAEALEQDDSGRVAYYLLHAMFSLELDCANEWAEMAMIGNSALAADRKKGPRRPR